MSVNGLPTSLTFRNMQRLITDIKNESLTARLETATGRKQDLAESLGGNVGVVQQLEKTQDDILDYRTAISLTKTRTDGAANGLDIAVTAAGDLPQDILGAVGLNDSEKLENASRAATRELEAVFSGLSTNIGGRYVFSGDQTDNPPLANSSLLIADIEAIAADTVNVTTPAEFEAALDAYFTRPDPDAVPPVVGGAFFTSIYQGGSGESPATEIDIGERIELGVRADDQPLVDLIRNLAALAVAPQLADATLRPPDLSDPANPVAYAFDQSALHETYTNAANGLAGAEKDVIDLRADLGFTQERIEFVEVRNINQETAIIESLNDVVAADPFEAATRLTFLETTLQTAFAATARLASLTLTSFLR